VDYRGLKAEDTEYFYTTPRSPANPQGNFNSTTSGEGRQTFTGLFGQTRVFPIDPLEITLSARRHLAHQRPGQHPHHRRRRHHRGDLPASDKSAFNPSLALRYELTDAASCAPPPTRLSARPASTTSPAPSAPAPAPPSPTPIGARNPHRLGSGQRLRKGPLSLSATYFMYDIKDMIATYTAKAGSAPAQVQLICGGARCPAAAARPSTTPTIRTAAHGIELSGNWRIRHDQPRRLVHHTETYLTRHGSHRHRSAARATRRVPKDLASLAPTGNPLNACAPLRSPLYRRDAARHHQQQHHALRAGFQHHRQCQRHLRLEKSVDVFGSVVNLFDRGYSENTYAYNQPYNRTLSQPRTLTAGVRVRF
jgi:iron complex outermembrane receptor protein